ncbi:SMI1/KNR4 family protein [Kaistia terrae]|uniref:SMI1/KNR4 family protein n=1 Tax=Kaistia terrae TaxID=537017 RepID=A0ABW0Q274_9HYPH|nr:SMI1/KNR4 family protein [Kaistia terrae]MCX5578861.1 SMI1/KNR4 family protein [Kaistia terrae]
MHPDYPPVPVAEEDLQVAENQLGNRFPEEYRRAVLNVGLLSPTVDLLSAIVERELDLYCLGDMYSPRDVIQETLSWREIGMPDALVAFAGDESGNKFCFSASHSDSGDASSRKIWLFDHDFKSVEEVATSFDVWIDALSTVEPLAEIVV